MPRPGPYEVDRFARYGGSVWQIRQPGGKCGFRQAFRQRQAEFRALQCLLAHLGEAQADGRVRRARPPLREPPIGPDAYLIRIRRTFDDFYFDWLFAV